MLWHAVAGDHRHELPSCLPTCCLLRSMRCHAAALMLRSASVARVAAMGCTSEPRTKAMTLRGGLGGFPWCKKKEIPRTRTIKHTHTHTHTHTRKHAHAQTHNRTGAHLAVGVSSSGLADREASSSWYLARLSSGCICSLSLSLSCCCCCCSCCCSEWSPCWPRAAGPVLASSPPAELLMPGLPLMLLPRVLAARSSKWAYVRACTVRGGSGAFGASPAVHCTRCLCDCIHICAWAILCMRN